MFYIKMINFRKYIHYYVHYGYLNLFIYQNRFSYQSIIFLTESRDALIINYRISQTVDLRMKTNIFISKVVI